MTFVVTESCIRCRFTDCVAVCPVECFHAGPNFLVIDPEACIDCALCVPECPVDAIVSDHELPPDQQAFLQINADLSRKWPTLTIALSHLPDADVWRTVPGKRSHLDTSPQGA